MSFIKNILTTMMSGHHGYNKQNGYSKNRGGHHGQRYYEEPVYDNNTPAASQVCSSCQHANSVQAKFCGQCGQSLSVGNCTACGQKLAPGAKFCGSCGQSV